MLIVLSGIIMLNASGCLNKSNITSDNRDLISATESVVEESLERSSPKTTKIVTVTDVPTKEPIVTKEPEEPVVTVKPVEEKVVITPETGIKVQVTPTPSAVIKVDTPAIAPTPVAVLNADGADCERIASKVIEYINSYRSNKLTCLSGLTEYAKYRSRQLVTNFSHDTFDERAAATALQYGTYIDPILYGIEGEPYYVSGANEAIVMTAYIGTVDEVAMQIANLIRNSSSHWSYVGSSEYKYIAVGVTFESGMWYCDVAVTKENTDNN